MKERFNLAHVFPVYLIWVFTIGGVPFAAAGETAQPLVEEASVMEIIDLKSQPWYKAEDNAVAREIASPRNSKIKSMSIAEIIIPAGVEVVPHHHVMEEVYYIIEGEGIMMVEDKEAHVQAGQAVVLAPHQWHNIRNHTDKKLRMIVTCVPSWSPDRLEFDRSTIPGAEDQTEGGETE